MKHDRGLDDLYLGFAIKDWAELVRSMERTAKSASKLYGKKITAEEYLTQYAGYTPYPEQHKKWVERRDAEYQAYLAEAEAKQRAAS